MGERMSFHFIGSRHPSVYKCGNMKRQNMENDMTPQHPKDDYSYFEW